MPCERHARVARSECDCSSDFEVYATRVLVKGQQVLGAVRFGEEFVKLLWYNVYGAIVKGDVIERYPQREQGRIPTRI